MKILVISNGRGEDCIALNLVKAFEAQGVTSICVYPLVGDGSVYKDAGYDIGLPNPKFPSGGFIRSFKDLCKDIYCGLIRHLFNQIAYIKSSFDDRDMVVAVGDVFCLFMAQFTKKPICFLPTAKSDSFMPHGLLERWYIRAKALKSFPRDLQTTTSFQHYGLNADFYGNPMMDQLFTNDCVVKLNKHDRCIGLLPGSREEAYDNMAYIMTVCEHIMTRIDNVVFVCAWVNVLDLALLIKKTGWLLQVDNDYKILMSKDERCYIVFTDQFKSVINQSSLCIGLAGTANEQAVYLGKRVVCFEGFGPQTTLQRFKEQQKLMGDLLTVCEHRDIKLIVNEVEKGLIEVTNNDGLYVTQKQASRQIILDILSLLGNDLELNKK